MTASKQPSPNRTITIGAAQVSAGLCGANEVNAMRTFTNGLRVALKAIWKVLCVLLVLLVVTMTVVMFMQIAMRTMGMQSYKWSEEVLRYLYIWVVFLGVPVAVYSNDLTRFDLIQSKLSPLANKILETLILIIMLGILFFMAQGSFTLIRIQMRQTMTSLNVPMGIVYLSIPICALASILFFVAKLFLLWTGQPDLDELQQPAEGGDPQ